METPIRDVLHRWRSPAVVDCKNNNSAVKPERQQLQNGVTLYIVEVIIALAMC